MQQFEGRRLPPGQTAAGQPAQPQQTESNPEDYGSITGHVFDAVTGQPLSKVQLTLFPANPGTGRREPYLTSSDSSGAYRFVNIEPGNYRLSAMRNRYVRQNYGQKTTLASGATITVAPKQQVANINFRLLPGAVVTGRVVDEEGEPMASVQVSALQYRYMRGRRELVPVASGATNDLGEYRIWGIAPGAYYFSATYRSQAMMYSGSTQQDDSGYPVNYYPGVPDPSQTSPIAVKAAEQKNGVDFRLSPIRTVRISGIVKSTTGSIPREIMLMLSKRDAFLAMERRGIPVREASGQFEISGVTPGSYVLQALTMRQEERLYAFVPVEVGASNIENLEVTLAPGLNLSGQVIVEQGAPQPPDLERLRIVMYPREDLMRFGPGGGDEVQRDGTFTLKNVAPMRSQLNVFPMPEGYYLKSVVLNGEEIVDTGINLTPGMNGANFTVILSPNAARLDGAVLDEKDRPFTGASVLLVPADKTKRETLLSFPTASSDQNGRYSLINLAPGDYLLFAFADVEPGAWQDPHFLARFEDQGRKVKLAPKDIQNLDLKLLRAGDEQ
jgi:protocatechuate 3,4-dioxygenase beta subunit